MREILFRGKTKVHNKWVYGWYCGKILSEDMSSTEESSQIIDAKTLYWHTCEAETVGQFTGLYDGTKWEDLTDAEKLDFYKKHYIGEDGMSVRFQRVDDVQHLWKGKKIFEGDILHSWSDYHKNYYYQGVVRYGEFNCSCCDGVYGWYLDGGDIRKIDSYEVCGNIHDNPELLEVSHD